MAESGGDPRCRFENVRPQWYVADIDRTAKYYRDVLGFRIKFLMGDPAQYGIVNRDEAAIHLAPTDGSGRRGPSGSTDAYIVVASVDALHLELKASGATITSEPETYGYGMREFSIVDCNGYHICFGQSAG